MTNRQKIQKVLDDTFWMAIRYAHGRSTSDPSMVRDSYRLIKEVYPNWELRPDHTLKADRERLEKSGVNRPAGLESDWLDDLMEE